MIVTGTSRASPRVLARDLLVPKGDKRVEVLELPYPADLLELLVDWQILSEVTHGLHGLYHALICPAAGNPMTPARWTRAADILGEELGLQEPYQRALVLHDDGVRPNLHVVWQRTSIDTWTLWSDSQNYAKHERASRRMELEFGNALVPDQRTKADPGLRPFEAPSASDPSAPKFNIDEGRQAKRTGVRITAMKTQVAALKAAAESPQAFKAALEDVGYILARGDSGYILIDPHGGVYSLAGQLRMKLARVNEFMAPVDLTALPTADQAKARQYQISLLPGKGPMTDQPLAPEAPKRPKRRTSEKLRRNKHITFKLSDDELNEALERASRSGLSMSAYARSAMLGDPGPGSRRRPSIDRELLLRTLATLAHLNHRADQIVRSITTSDISEIHQIGKDFKPLRDAIFAALPKRRNPAS